MRNANLFGTSITFDGETVLIESDLVSAKPVNSECRHSTAALPVLIMNGTTDPLLPYNGGQIDSNHGEVYSTPEMAPDEVRGMALAHGLQRLTFRWIGALHFPLDTLSDKQRVIGMRRVIGNGRYIADDSLNQRLLSTTGHRAWGIALSEPIMTAQALHSLHCPTYALPDSQKPFVTTVDGMTAHPAVFTREISTSRM